MAGVGHRVERAADERTFGPLGHRHAPLAAQVVPVVAAERNALVVEPDLAAAHQHVGVVQLVTVPGTEPGHRVGIVAARRQLGGGLAGAQHRLRPALPRPLRRGGPGHPDLINRTLPVGSLQHLVVEVVAAAERQHVGREHRAVVEGAARAARDRPPALLPVEPVAAGGVPHLAQVPVPHRDRVAGAGEARRRRRLAPRVPHVVALPDPDHLARVAPAHPRLLADAGDRRVLERREELAALILGGAVHRLHAAAGGAQRAASRRHRRCGRGGRRGRERWGRRRGLRGRTAGRRLGGGGFRLRSDGLRLRGGGLRLPGAGPVEHHVGREVDRFGEAVVGAAKAGPLAVARQVAVEVGQIGVAALQLFARHVRQPPGNAAPVPAIGEHVGGERPARGRRQHHVRGHLEVEAVGRVLHRVLLRAVVVADRGHPFPVGEQQRLVAAVGHRVERRLAERAFRARGGSHAPADAAVPAGAPAHRLALVVEPHLPAAYQRLRVVHLVAVPSAVAAHRVVVAAARPLAGRAGGEHRAVVAPPRSRRGLGPGHADHVAGAQHVGMPHRLVVEVVAAAPLQDAGGEHAAPVEGAARPRRHRAALLPPSHAVGRSGMPDLRQVPVEGSGAPTLITAGAGAVAGVRFTAGAARVPHVVAAAGPHHGAGVAPRHARFRPQPRQQRIGKSGVELVDRVAVAAPALVEPAPGGAQRPPARRATGFTGQRRPIVHEAHRHP